MQYLNTQSLNFPSPINIKYAEFAGDKIVLLDRTYNSLSGEFIKNYAKAQIYNYVSKHIEDYENISGLKSLIDKYPDCDRSTVIAYWLQSLYIDDEIGGGYIPDGTYVSGLELSAYAKLDILKSASLTDYIQEAVVKRCGEECSGKLVGVYIPNEINGLYVDTAGKMSLEEKNKIIVSPFIYARDKSALQEQKLIADKGIIRISSDREERLKEIVESYTDWSVMSVSNRQLCAVIIATGSMEIIKKICMWIALVLGIFSILMYANYLISSIMARKREIGVLRAIGATNTDVFRITLLEGAIIFAITFILSTCLGAILSVVFNALISSSITTLATKVVMFGFRQAALMLVVSATVTVIVSLAGSYIVSKRRPSINLKQQ